MKKLISFLIACCITAALVPLSPAVADAGSNAPVLLDAGAPAPVDAGTAKPSDTLDDPIAAPAAAWDDVKAAKKTGWSLALLGVLIMAARTAAGARNRYPWLAFLAKGKAAIGIAAILAIATASFDTLALGGSWVAVLFAGAGALFALLIPTAPPAKETA